MTEHGWTDLGPEHEAYLRVSGALRGPEPQPHGQRSRVSPELAGRELPQPGRRPTVTAPAPPTLPETPFSWFGIVVISLMVILLIVLFNTLGSPSSTGFSGGTNASRADSRNSCPELLPGWEEYCDMLRYMKCQNAGNTECLREFGVMYPPGSSVPAPEAAQEPADAPTQDDGVPRSRAHDP